MFTITGVRRDGVCKMSMQPSVHAKPGDKVECPNCGRQMTLRNHLSQKTSVCFPRHNGVKP